MFGTSYRYFNGVDGRHYCFAIEPSFTCPANLSADDELLVKMAGELGVRPLWLAGKLRHHTDRARDEKGRLTDDCANCGARMKRLGFAWWIEAKAPKSDAVARINQRLGGDGFVRAEGPWYTSTKKDARTMALGRSKAPA